MKKARQLSKLASPTSDELDKTLREIEEKQERKSKNHLKILDNQVMAETFCNLEMNEIKNLIHFRRMLKYCLVFVRICKDREQEQSYN